MENYLEVVVALISAPLDAHSQQRHSRVWRSNKAYFIAERTNGAFAGLLEFPGGKIDAGETAYAALCREVQEEIGIQVLSARPLMQLVTPRVGCQNSKIRLHIWDVLKWTGTPYGAEGQPARWSQLIWEDQTLFLPPNRHIFTALRLGAGLVIVNANELKPLDLAQKLQQLHRNNQHCDYQLMVRLRANGMTSQLYYELAQHAQSLLTAADSSPALQLCIDVLPGLELQGTNSDFNWQPQQQLAYFPSWWQNPEYTYPLQAILEQLNTQAPGLLRGAACHNAAELEWACGAEGLGADFYCLSPAQMTNSHPGEAALGWREWSMLNQTQSQPGFALGGVGIQDLLQIRTAGGFGMAGIECFASDTLVTEWRLMHSNSIQSKPGMEIWQ